MAKGGIRFSYTSEHGWRMETGTGDDAPKRSKSKPSRRTAQRRRASDIPGEPVDVTVAFQKAHEWLNRVEEVIVAARSKSSAANDSPDQSQSKPAEPEPEPQRPGPTPPSGGDPQSADSAASATPPPPNDPVELPDSSLEPVVPAWKIHFGTEGESGPGDLPPTRFGGQPDWLDSPQWPVSRELGTPMEFIAQIALHPDTFPWVDEPKMAYLFETDDSEDPGGPPTWEPFGGENALIVQPGTAPTWVEITSLRTGPSRQEIVPVSLTPQVDPALLDDYQMGELRRLDPAMADRFHELVDYDKLGGTPNFFQGLELPDFETLATSPQPGASIPIMMIRNFDATQMNLGDAGRAVSFLSPDQRQGAHLWFN